MATGLGSAPVNKLPPATTIGLVFGSSHTFGSVAEGEGFRNAIAVSDADLVSVRLSVEFGTIELGPDLDGVGVSGEPPDGPPYSSVTLTGSAGAINTALTGLTYHAPGNPSPSATAPVTDYLTITSTDEDGRADVDAVVFQVST